MALPDLEYRSRIRGFTLMELSIVLVVVGILMGAVLGGQHLLHTMRLNKVSEEMRNYESAIMLFNQRYGGLPGDMPNATDYWGQISGDDGCLIPEYGDDAGNSIDMGTGTQTCNGNDDDKIGDWDLPDLYHEMFRAWQHLHNADLVGRAFSGVSGPDSDMDARAGTNIPTGPFSGSGWSIMRLGYYVNQGDTTNPFFNRAYGNVLLFGAESAGYPSRGPVLTPIEARNIDRKIDDSTPAGGNITPVLSGSSPTSGCTSASGDSTVLTATYNTDNEEVACALYFVLPEEVRGLLEDDY